MSAPNEGRQSPEPERQTESQQAAPPAQPRKADGSTASGNSEGHNDTSKLASNPEHPLEKKAEEKTSKTMKWFGSWMDSSGMVFRGLGSLSEEEDDALEVEGWGFKRL